MRAIKPDTFPKTQRNPLYDTLIIAKSVKYSAIQKESIETVKESKFFLHYVSRLIFFPFLFPPLQFYFPPPHFFIHFSIHIHTSTSYRLYMDPTWTLDSTLCQHSFVNSETIYHHLHHRSIVFLPPPPHLYCFPPPPPINSSEVFFYCFVFL